MCDVQIKGQVGDAPNIVILMDSLINLKDICDKSMRGRLKDFQVTSKFNYNLSLLLNYSMMDPNH